MRNISKFPVSMHLIVHDKVIELSKNPMSKISYSWLVILKEDILSKFAI